jgi:hypothetical protein
MQVVRGTIKKTILSNSQMKKVFSVAARKRVAILASKVQLPNVIQRIGVKPILVISSLCILLPEHRAEFRAKTVF